jgi:hypothetical protein
VGLRGAFAAGARVKLAIFVVAIFGAVAVIVDAVEALRYKRECVRERKREREYKSTERLYTDHDSQRGEAGGVRGAAPRGRIRGRWGTEAPG